MAKTTPIQINGETHHFETEIDLHRLLTQLRIESRSIAIAVNDVIVPPSERGDFQLKAGDRVEIVRAVAGG